MLETLGGRARRSVQRAGPLLLLGLFALGCRSVRTERVKSGTYRISEANAGSELSGVELKVDVEGRRAELRDGTRSIPLALAPLTREEWRQDCGTMSSYSLLETMRVAAPPIELRGVTASLTRLSADCGAGVELHGDLPRRWIFDPVATTP